MLHSPQQERAGSDRRVQQSDRGQRLRGFPIGLEKPALRLSVTTAETGGQKRAHPGSEQPAYHGCRGVEGAGFMAELRRHHTFEYASEHVRRYAAAGPIFSYSEMESLEQPVEGVTPEIIRNVRLETALERVRLEQASIQEGNWTKCRGTSTATELPAG